MDTKIRSLIEWVARDAYREPMPRGTHVVNATFLLNEIASIWGINRNKVGETANQVREEAEDA